MAKVGEARVRLSRNIEKGKLVYSASRLNWLHQHIVYKSRKMYERWEELAKRLLAEKGKCS